MQFIAVFFCILFSSEILIKMNQNTLTEVTEHSEDSIHKVPIVFRIVIH
jgi:hypothetical protein